MNSKESDPHRTAQPRTKKEGAVSDITKNFRVPNVAGAIRGDFNYFFRIATVLSNPGHVRTDRYTPR